VIQVNLFGERISAEFATFLLHIEEIGILEVAIFGLFADSDSLTPIEYPTKLSDVQRSI